MRASSSHLVGAGTSCLSQTPTCFCFSSSREGYTWSRKNSFLQILWYLLDTRRAAVLWDAAQHLRRVEALGYRHEAAAPKELGGDHL